MRLTHAEINLTALRSNFNAIRRHVGPGVKIMGIVKANAYGHGFVEVAKSLVEYGVDYLGVGFLEEGVVLRQNGVGVPVLVLGGVLGHQIGEFLANDLEITVSSTELARWIENDVARRNSTKARVHLKIDTGMERIGVRAENAIQFAENVCRLPHLDVVGIYSHFATSEERDKTFAVGQLGKFLGVLESLRKTGIEIPVPHMANSGAIIDMPDARLAMVRPGISLYGIYPSRETSESIPLKPVLTLKSSVVFIKDVPAGTSISYGRKYFTKDKTRIATIPVGYGDGYRRALSNTADVLIRGVRCRIVGTVCMDQIMVDIGAVPDVHVGEEVVLIGRSGGESISAWELSSLHGSIPYELLTGLTARVPRVFIQ
jgi:alanine racemase